MNLRVVRALVLKYAFIYSRNTFRVLDVFFWPLMDLVVWGFVTMYMLKISNSLPAAITFLIAAAIFWNVLYRGQQVVSVSFLDDVWSRNILNIFASPIRPVEYVASVYFMGFVQGVIVVLLMGVLAMPMYNFNLFSMGFNLGLLFVNLLVMGWALGLLVIGCVIRFGPPAEVLAWAVPFLVQPISAVFYPVSVLPPWLQPVALCVPSTHVFEGMRQILSTGTLDVHHLWWAFGLNAVYIAAAALVFTILLEKARSMGFLARYGT